jgi:3-methylcrotonyl-CoA carboxylase alpha subunit
MRGPIDKVLIANRGEIACRIARTARSMGIATVAVYSDADRGAPHTRLCDEAVRIGPAPARESYLSVEAVLRAAHEAGADALHPGYGFLSENAGFAEACARAGIAFVGPPAAAIRAMGSKSAAKALMEKAGVPLLPGYHGDKQAPSHLKKEAARIGYPVLIKASLGGGGKGMRVVERAADFESALESCRREARSSFGDDAVLLEKYLPRARHIEMQVFADTHGNCIHLFERDCSVQRRHQKVLEEAPAPGMTDERRARMGEAAVAAAKAVGYVGAGTIEFLASPEGEFHFMEMNTRLQVEHPVTEMITGLDLVEWQFRVAAGERLPLAQEQVKASGHAIEVRIYAEDPRSGFLPSTGRLAHLSMPEPSDHIRVDAGVEQGSEITPWYDPMIAKLIAWDSTRERAVGRVRAALGRFEIAGVASNVEFLARLIDTPSFREENLDTALIERERERLFADRSTPCEAVLLAARRLLDEESPPTNDPWSIRDGWRLNGAARRRLELKEGTSVHAVIVHGNGDLELDGVVSTGQAQGTVVSLERAIQVFYEGASYLFRLDDPLAPAEEALADGAILAPMPGRIVALLCEAGAAVEKGTPLLVLEAMKMEHTIVAPGAGTLKAHRYAVGDQVALGAQLVDFEP